jgi:hypothetical protein
MDTKMFKRLFKACAVLSFVWLGTSAQATVITSGQELNFGWSFNSAAGTLTGTGSIEYANSSSPACTNSTSILCLLVTLNNNSTLSSNRLTSFGFGINPNATGVSLLDAADNGMVGAELNQIPSLSAIEVCAFGGNNCPGGSNGGIFGGSSDSFVLRLVGTWNGTNGVDIAPIGFKFQTGSGSFEFTTTNVCVGIDCDIPPPSVPEPGSLALLGAGLAGLALIRRRRRD